jgi:hypothetical protein
MTHMRANRTASAAFSRKASIARARLRPDERRPGSGAQSHGLTRASRKQWYSRVRGAPATCHQPPRARGRKPRQNGAFAFCDRAEGRWSTGPTGKRR